MIRYKSKWQTDLAVQQNFISSSPTRHCIAERVGA
jgi:hypothetical protein